MLPAPAAGSFWFGANLPPPLSLLLPSAAALLLAWGALSLARKTGDESLLPRLLLVAALSLMALWSGPAPSLLYLAVVIGGLAWAAGSAWRWLHFLLVLTATAHWGFGYVETCLEPAPSAGPGAAAHAVQALLEKEPGSVSALWVDRTRRDRRMQAVLDLAKKAGVTLHKVEREELDERCGSSQHQGVVAESALSGAWDEGRLM